jgi:raffinose/stachyose/melibiose transport system substrate-binding protein
VRGHRSHTRGRLASASTALLLTAALGAGAAAPALAQDGPQTSGWDALGDVTLRIAGEQASEVTLTQLAEQFTDQYPNVTIEAEFKSFDDFMATVLNVADAPDAPDIIFGNQGYTVDGPLVEAGLIVSLEPYYEAYGWDEWYGEGAMDQFRFSEDGTDFGTGPRWGIAESADFVGVYYNVDKLAALGLEAPETFADFEAALAAANEAGELPIKLGNQPGWPAIHAIGIAQGAFWPADEARAWVFGEEGADYSAPASLEAAQTFRGWVDQGYVNEDANALDYDQAWQEFAKGDGVFLPGGSWLAAGLRDSMGEDEVGFMAPPPGDSGSVVAVAALSLPFHISSRSENPDLAAGFIDFVMAPDKGQVYFDNGRIPAAAGSTGTAGDSVTAALNDAWVRIAEDDGLIYYQDWATDTMFGTLGSALQELIGGRTSPEDFVNTVQDDWAAFHGTR